MVHQTDKSLRDFKALIQNWSYQPTSAGRAITRWCIKTVKALIQNWSFQPTLVSRAISEKRVRQNLRDQTNQRMHQTIQTVDTEEDLLHLQRTV